MSFGIIVERNKYVFIPPLKTLKIKTNKMDSTKNNLKQRPSYQNNAIPKDEVIEEMINKFNDNSTGLSVVKENQTIIFYENDSEKIVKKLSILKFYQQYNQAQKSSIDSDIGILLGHDCAI